VSTLTCHLATGDPGAAAASVLGAAETRGVPHDEVVRLAAEAFCNGSPG